MISPSLESLRTALHLLAAAVWVGGQLVLAGIVPVLRREAPQALASAARAFARMAWPALFVLLVTGAWSLTAENAGSRDTEWLATLAIKLLAVGVAIAGTLAHSYSKKRTALILGGALSLLGSLIAFYLGVLLAHVG